MVLLLSSRAIPFFFLLVHSTYIHANRKLICNQRYLENRFSMRWAPNLTLSRKLKLVLVFLNISKVSKRLNMYAKSIKKAFKIKKIVGFFLFWFIFALCKVFFFQFLFYLQVQAFSLREIFVMHMNFSLETSALNMYEIWSKFYPSSKAAFFIGHFYRGFLKLNHAASFKLARITNTSFKKYRLTVFMGLYWRNWSTKKRSRLWTSEQWRERTRTTAIYMRTMRRQRYFQARFHFSCFDGCKDDAQ